MKESTLLDSSGLSLTIANPNNGTALVLNLPPGLRTGWLKMHGPLGERTIYLRVSVDPDAGDQDLVVDLSTQPALRVGQAVGKAVSESDEERTLIPTARTQVKSTALAQVEPGEEKSEEKGEEKGEEKSEEKPAEKPEEKPEEKKAPAAKATSSKPNRPGNRT